MSINGYKLNCKITRTPATFIHNFKIANLPETVDLRSKAGKVYDQGQLGACTANSICSAYIFDDPSADPSRLYLYYKELSAQGNVNEDTGSTLTEGITQAKTGICKEELWPYDTSKFSIKPSSQCDEDAKLHHVIDAFQVEQTLESMKGCLAHGFPFVLGFVVFPSFEKATDGIIPMPTPDEVAIGGHAIEVVGYTKTHWIVKNSWSEFYGDKGYCYVPLQYYTNASLTSDIWKITKVTPPVENKENNISEVIVTQTVIETPLLGNTSSSSETIVPVVSNSNNEIADAGITGTTGAETTITGTTGSNTTSTWYNPISWFW